MAWLTAGVLFLLAGTLQVVMLFTNVRGDAGSPSGELYNSVAFDVDFGLRAVFMLVCGALLLNRRAREWAAGFAAGFGLVSLAGYFWQLRPSQLTSSFVAVGSGLYVAVNAITTVGSVIMLIVLVRRRRRGGDARSRAERRADRIVAVALAFTGAVLWTIGSMLAWNRTGVGTATTGIERTEDCCSWSQDDGWKQVSLLVGAATLIVLGLLAAALSSKIRAAGLLLGLVAAQLPGMAVAVATRISPLATVYGIHYRDVVPASVRVVDTLTIGFWTDVAALLLLSGVVVSRLALGPRKAAYPRNELERIAS